MTKRLKQLFTFRTLAFIALMLFSFATTGIGIASQLDTLNDPAFRYGISFTLSGALQAMIGFIWGKAGRLYSSRSMAFFIVGLVAVIPTLFSTGLASSANLYFYLRHVVTERAVGEGRDKVLAPVRVVYDRASALSNGFIDYSEYAAAQSERERRFGDSCENVKVKKRECGPLCRLRASQSKNASKQSSVADGLRAEALQLQAKSGGTLSQADVNALYVQAGTLSVDPRFRQAQRFIRSELGGFQSTFQLDNGKRRQCTDQGAVSRLQKLDELLSRPIDVSSAPPTLRKINLSSTAEDNFALMAKTAANLLDPSTPISQALSRDNATFAFVWLATLLIDLACAAFAFAGGISSNPHRGLPKDILGDHARGKMSKENEELLVHVQELVTELRVDMGNNTYLAIPRGGPMTGKLARVGNLPFLKQLGAKLTRSKIKSVVNVYDMVPSYADRLKAISGTEDFVFWRYHNADKFEALLARKIALV